MRADRHNDRLSRSSSAASAFGILLSLGVNCAVIFGCSFNGLKYVYPPPEEKSLLLDFEELPEVKTEKEVISPAVAEEVKPDGQTNLVQQAGEPEEPQPEAIDTRALFHTAKAPAADSSAVSDTDAVADALRQGQQDGNTELARADGTPSASLKGRKVVGQLAKPRYEVQASGTVVVEIWVDRQGGVTRANPGYDGTTTSDMNLWKAARQAALKTSFNIDYDAPGLQKGTITYIFELQ